MHPYHHANAEKRGKAHDLIARTGNRMERRAPTATPRKMRP